MKWVIVILVTLLYVHLFNALARLYFESGRTLALKDLWRRFFPGVKIHIEL
jgi:hypothetical protein